MSPPSSLRAGSVVRGPTLPEPVEVLALVALGDSVKIIGRGLQTGLTHDPVLTPDQLARLTISADQEPFDGDARLFRLGIEAHRLGLAYEYDPFFSLSIARVDPLPHQLEAVYDYFLRLPRIRFLLADDPGAGKTIMAGLLLKELKARGLGHRPAAEGGLLALHGLQLCREAGIVCGSGPCAARLEPGPDSGALPDKRGIDFERRPLLRWQLTS